MPTTRSQHAGLFNDCENLDDVLRAGQFASLDALIFAENVGQEQARFATQRILEIYAPGFDFTKAPDESQLQALNAHIAALAAAATPLGRVGDMDLEQVQCLVVLAAMMLTGEQYLPDNESKSGLSKDAASSTWTRKTTTALAYAANHSATPCIMAHVNKGNAFVIHPLFERLRWAALTPHWTNYRVRRPTDER